MKLCRICLLAKPEDCFAWKKKGVTRQGCCRKCKTVYNRQWYIDNEVKQKAAVQANRRLTQLKHRAIVDAAKNVPCMDCGVRYPSYVMDFDHQGNKSFTISMFYRKVPEQKLRDEIAKCEVVCANCHRIRTHGAPIA